ncbi:LysR family transcriptional regulator [Pseudonocardia xishanensis]|uniref:LysR family transcriptional regulator n=1 Tax=Pseudonocardia xishanensis TaxID=630995 RepID=A0ABP8S0V6_9PSEU
MAVVTWRPDPESLSLLVLVGERGSLTAAACELGITQPAASKRISLLERRLGVRLLVRTRQGSALTESGDLVAGWARRVLDELDTLVDGAAALRRRSAAQLAVAASLTVAEHLLPTWLGELRAGAATLRVGLEVTNSTRVCAMVRGGSADVGFIESPGVLAGLRGRPVAQDRLVLVVAPGHPWARRRRTVEAAELARTPLISREEGSGTRDTAERALAEIGERLVAPLLELGSSAAVRSTVLAGGGPALLSELVVGADVAVGALVEVPVARLDLGRTLRVVWRAGQRPSGAAGALVELAVAAGQARSSSARGVGASVTIAGSEDPLRNGN